MPTIIDVANRAGVSPATVSRALGNSVGVSSEKKKRIFEAIEELDYKTDKIQKGRQERRRIVLITTMAVPELIRGIEKICCRRDYELMIVPVGIEVQTLEKAYAKLADLEEFIAGILVYGLSCDERSICRIKEHFKVVVMGDNEACGTYIVGSDNVSASKDIVNHMIQKGHRKIALITGNPLDARVKAFSSEREVGYMKAFLENGIEYNSDWVMKGEITEESGYELTKKLLSGEREIDAIFCVSDAIAMGCLQALHEMNVVVPHDVAVCGFDNARESKWSIPRLTTVEQNLTEMGMRAAGLLFDLLEGGEYENCKIYVKHSLIYRDSL